MSLCKFLEVLYFMKKTILLTFLLSSALLIMNVSAFAADVNSFSDLAAGGDLTFAQDIVVESATPSVTLPDGTVVDGAHHSLTGVQGTYLNIGSNTSTVTLKNIGDIQDGSSTDNTFSYQNAAGDTVYKKITNSFNGFHKTEWGQAPAQNKLLGTVNIDNSVFSNNVSDEDAGVFFASNALLTITNSTFYDNHAASNWYGGGVIQTLTNNSQLLTIDSSLFVNNTAGEGGALDTSVQTYISNSVFANNQAIGYDGGAIWYGMAAVSANYVNYLINSEFVNNTATQLGGALSLDGLNDGMNIINTSFRGNQAAYGGAIHALKFRDGIPLSVVDSSFTNNTANEGAGIYSGNIDLNIFAVNKDVVFDGNTATNETASYNAGSDIYFDAGGNDATLFLNAASGKKIIFNGSIASYTDNTVASIDINKPGLTYSPDTGITTEMVSDASSQIQFNNRVGDDTYNFDINLYNGVLAIGQNPTINAGVDNPDGFIDGNNLHVMAESTLYTINDVIGSVNLKGLDLSSNLNIQADADLATSTMDTIHVDTVTGTEKIVLSGVNVLSDTTGDSTVVQFTDTNLADYVAVKDDLQALSPVYKYTVANNGDGSLTFTRFNDNPDPDDPRNYNPTVFEPTIAVNTVSNVQDYINSLVFRDFTLFEHNDFKQQGKAAGDFGEGRNVWLKAYGYNDRTDYRHFSDVKTRMAMFFLGLSQDINFFESDASKLNVYAGYLNGNIRYDDIHVDQPGEYLGANIATKYENFIVALNMTGGYMHPKTHDMYGKHRTNNPWGGIAADIGYQIEVSPSLMLMPSFVTSYTYVHGDDYTNPAHIRVKSDDLQVFEFVPNLRGDYRLSQRLELFGDVRYSFSHKDGGNSRVEGMAIPTLNMARFVEYGLGTTAHFNDYTFEIALYRRDGGREGWNGYINLRYHF